MADQKISQLNTITGANVDDAADKLAIVDTSGNETKAITRGELFKAVDGTTFHVDSTNNRVGIGTTSPSTELDVVGDAEVNGNITVTGTVDGRDVASDGTKLDGIETGATADQTGPEIKSLYEAQSNTNAFTDTEKSKLAGIETGADVTDTANVTAAGALMDSELTNIAAVKALNQGVATTNSPTFAGQTINGNITVTGTVDGRDVAADGTKLDGIEAGADVTDTANVTAAIGQGVGTTDSPNFAGLTVDTNTLHVDSTNNRVGIGTITPDTALEVDGDVTVSDAFPVVNLRDKNSTDTSIGGLFSLTNADGTDPVAWFGVPDEDGVVHIRAYYGDIALSPGSAASRTEVMRIQDNGRVGIGTTSPGAALDVDAGVVKLNGNTINSVQVTVADDAVASLTFTNRSGGMLTVVETSDGDLFPDSNVYFLGYFDFGSSPATNTAVKGAVTDIVTTTLSGTTGTDGRATIGGTGGTLYIENRRGSTLTFNVTLM